MKQQLSMATNNGNDHKVTNEDVANVKNKAFMILLKMFLNMKQN